MRRIRPGCCARSASGHAAAPPSSMMNSRRFTSKSLLCLKAEDSTARALLHWTRKDPQAEHSFPELRKVDVSESC
jgi:hypothetical protein